MRVLTVFIRELGSKTLGLNSSSAFLAQMPAPVFSESISLRSFINSLVLFLSTAVFSLLNLAFWSSEREGSFSKSLNFC